MDVHPADDLACRGILDLLPDALDAELIADLDAGLAADVQHHLRAVDGRDQALDHHLANRDAAALRDDVAAHLLDGDLDGLADDRALEVAVAEVDVAGAETATSRRRRR